MNIINLESLTIFQLRELARELNIKSPSTKKRDLLISLIKLAQKDNLPETYKAPNKKGRPIKTRQLLYINDISPLLEILDDINAIKIKIESLENKIRKNVE